MRKLKTVKERVHQIKSDNDQLTATDESRGIVPVETGPVSTVPGHVVYHQNVARVADCSHDRCPLT